MIACTCGVDHSLIAWLFGSVLMTLSLLPTFIYGLIARIKKWRRGEGD